MVLNGITEFFLVETGSIQTQKKWKPVRKMRFEEWGHLTFLRFGDFHNIVSLFVIAEDNDSSQHAWFLWLENEVLFFQLKSKIQFEKSIFSVYKNSYYFLSIDPFNMRERIKPVHDWFLSILIYEEKFWVMCS